MTVAAAHAAVFYREVAAKRCVWTIRDKGGFPAPMTRSGLRAHAFWSSESRVKKIIANVPAYAGFTPVTVSWEEFREQWIPGMARDGLLVGVNWSGRRAMGYDIAPLDVLENITHAIQVEEIKAPSPK